MALKEELLAKLEKNKERPVEFLKELIHHITEGGDIQQYPGKEVPVGDDLLSVQDSEDNYGFKKVKMNSLPSGTVVVNTKPAKEKPVNSDLLLIEDSQENNAQKKIKISELESSLYHDKLKEYNPREHALIINEDNLSSEAEDKVPSQKSVKAYVEKHREDSYSVHGIKDTSKLASIEDIKEHSQETAIVHGIEDVSKLVSSEPLEEQKLVYGDGKQGLKNSSISVDKKGNVKGVRNLQVEGQVTSKIHIEKQMKCISHVIDWDNGLSIEWDLENAIGDITVTFNNPKPGASYAIKIIQSSEMRQVKWPAEVLWSKGKAPELSNGKGKIDFVTLFYDGSKYIGNFGQDYS